MKNPNLPGSFLMHKDGESDMRANYCAIVAANLLNVLDEDIVESVAENIGNS